MTAPTLIDGLLVIAPLAIVPAARRLLEHDRLPRPGVTALAALALAAAFATDRGSVGALLAVPWLAVCVVALTRNLWSAGNERRITLVTFALVAAHGFLAVGAFFAFASRAGWSVAGIHEPIVELTGVHFHYAGFASLTLAMCVARAPRVPRRATVVMLGLGIGAPPVVAAGFTWRLALFQIGGATLMTAFVYSISGLTLRYVARDVAPRARALLIVSSLSVLAPMVLGIMWAAGQYFAVPALSISAMARVHGTMNAFGFVDCGVLGWRLVGPHAYTKETAHEQHVST